MIRYHDLSHQADAAMFAQIDGQYPLTSNPLRRAKIRKELRQALRQGYQTIFCVINNDYGFLAWMEMIHMQTRLANQGFHLVSYLVYDAEEWEPLLPLGVCQLPQVPFRRELARVVDVGLQDFEHRIFPAVGVLLNEGDPIYRQDNLTWRPIPHLLADMMTHWP